MRPLSMITCHYEDYGILMGIIGSLGLDVLGLCWPFEVLSVV